MSARDEAFLSRWSRLKKQGGEAMPAVDAETNLPTPQTTPETVTEPEPDGETLEKIRQDLGLPDPASLTKDSDFTPFMGDGVPEILKRQALRMLWRSDPVLANLDGLNEYDEDYRAAMMVKEVITSSWKPGRGYADPETKTEMVEEAEPVEDAEPVAVEVDPDGGDEVTRGGSDAVDGPDDDAELG